MDNLSAAPDAGPDSERKARIIKEFDALADVKLTEAQWSTIAARLNINPETEEMMVLRGVMAGLKDPGIERIMNRSHGTIRSYLDRLFIKAGTRSRIGLAMKAMEGLIICAIPDK